MRVTRIKRACNSQLQERDISHNLWNSCCCVREDIGQYEGRNIYLLLLLSLFSIVFAHEDDYCLTNDETNTIISRWTSIAIKIDLKVVNETVTDTFQFFSDSQDFLEGLPVSLPTISKHLLEQH